MQNTFGVQIRNDDIASVALYHTESRARIATLSEAAVLATTSGLYLQNELEWAPWFRTTAGLRGDVSRYRVDALDAINSGTVRAGLVSPKGGATLGPWKGTELYVNAGEGFHSNDARGTTIVRNLGRRGHTLSSRGAEDGRVSLILGF